VKYREEIAKILVTVEEHRRMNANLNAALMSESARKKALERENSSLKQALKVATKQTEDMAADKVTCERAITRNFQELADTRSEAEATRRTLQDEVVSIRNDRHTTERKLEAAIQEIMDLSAHLDESNRAYLTAQRDLDTVHRELAISQTAHAECEAVVIMLRDDYDTLSMDYNKILSEKAAFELTLVQAQQMIEREMASTSEAITALCIEQEKTQALESQLMKSNDFLISVNELVAAFEAGLDELKDVDDTRSDVSEESSLAWSISMFALEIERDMHQAQELEALEALEAEKEARLVLEKELALYREKDQRILDADTEKIIAAETQADLNTRTDPVQVETDLEDGDDTRSDISEESELAWSISMFALEIERDMHQAQEFEALEALKAEKEAKAALEKELELYRALEADQEKENMSAQLQAALNTISELRDAIEAEKNLHSAVCSQLAAERDAHADACDTLQFLKLRISSPTREREMVQQRLIATPAKFSRSNKENYGLVYQVSSHSST
jgi:hypothetical protein